MTGAPLLPTRSERAVAARGLLAAPRGGTDTPSDLTAEQQARIAAQHQAFDFEAAERSEILREHAVLQAMLMEQLKNDTLRTIATRGALLCIARRARAVGTPVDAARAGRTTFGNQARTQVKPSTVFTEH